MELATLIPLALKTSIVLIVVALGLNARLEDALYLFRRPAELARSLLAMYVVMPLFAAAIVAFLDLRPAVKIALVALALSPVPPLFPKKALKAGGDTDYTIGLLVMASVLAIVLLPLGVQLLSAAFGTEREMPFPAVLELVATTVLLPLAVGIAVRRLAPEAAGRLAKPVALLGTVLLAGGALPILITSWPAIVATVGSGSILAILAFVLVGLAAGHLLGGPDPDDRTALALANATRHPGMALAIASATFPEQKLALAAVVLYLLVGGVVSLPYLRWRKGKSTGTPAAPGTP